MTSTNDSFCRFQYKKKNSDPSYVRFWSYVWGVMLTQSVHVMVFWAEMPCSDVVGCQHFGGPCCFYLTLKMETAISSESLISYHITTWHHNPEDHNLNLYCHENLKSWTTDGVDPWLYQCRQLVTLLSFQTPHSEAMNYTMICMILCYHRTQFTKI